MNAVVSNQLNTLKPGQSATILAVHAKEDLHHRLVAMGFRTGKRVEVIRKGFWHGPLHVRLGTTDVIIRRSDAACIDIHFA